MSLEAVAARYANALYELGQEEGNLQSLVEQVQRIGDVYEHNKELQRVLDNPVIEEQARRAMLDEIAQRLALGSTLTTTLRLLAQRHRLVLLPLIARHVLRQADEGANVVRASVTSAAPLSDAYRQQLMAELERATGKRVLLDTTVDPALLGGIVTRVGDKLLDGSVRAQLARLKQSLLV